MYPYFHYPILFILKLLRDVLFLRPRNFVEDAKYCVAYNSECFDISGLENIPQNTPFLLTMNHYARNGFKVWWLVFGIASVMPPDLHLIMTDELTRWHPPLGQVVSKFALPRLAKIYGFTTMPPMPPRPQDVDARAKSVREVLRFVESAPVSRLLIAPEGRDNLVDGSLDQPPEGVGRFLLLAATRGLSLIPVGGWEADGRLKVRFGPGYQLSVPSKLSSKEKDMLAVNIVMNRIAVLLPQNLRGRFG